MTQNKSWTYIKNKNMRLYWLDPRLLEILRVRLYESNVATYTSEEDTRIMSTFNLRNFNGVVFYMIALLVSGSYLVRSYSHG